MTTNPGPGAETERFGRPFRHYQAAISAGTQALAWARQEDAPAGAAVVVEQEISPLGRRGRIWQGPAEDTLACAVVLRPPLPAEQGDLAWLVGAVASAEGAEMASERKMATWWPDGIRDAETGDEVGVVKAEVQLGPGKVSSAILTTRLGLAALGLEAGRRDELLEALFSAYDRVSAMLEEDDGAASAAAAYESRCGLMGQRVKVRLLPKGETRGMVGGIDRTARLELKSSTGMVERISIDMLGELTVL